MLVPQASAIPPAQVLTVEQRSPIQEIKAISKAICSIPVEVDDAFPRILSTVKADSKTTVEPSQTRCRSPCLPYWG